MHIGIVENDSAFRDDILLTLKKLMPAVKLDWWQSAENLLKENIDEMPDILLLDVMLPVMRGTEMVASALTDAESGAAVGAGTLGSRRDDASGSVAPFATATAQPITG